MFKYLPLFLALTSSAAVPVIGTNKIYATDVDGIPRWLPVTNLTIPRYGGTVEGPILSVSPSTNSPANTELATAGFVRNLISGSGVFFYNSTNITSLTNVDAATPVYAYITNIPYPNVRSYNGLTNGQYVGSVSTTNKFQQIQGPLTINSYMNLSANSLSLKPEIYYSHDGTNWLGDYEAESKAIVTGSTNLYSWVINVPTIIATNAAGFYIERRFKVTAISGNPTLNIWVGTNTPSNISFDGPNTASGQAFLAASQTFTGVNTFSNSPLVWGGYGYNPVRLFGTRSGNAGSYYFNGTTEAVTNSNGGTIASRFGAGQNVAIYVGVPEEDVVGTNWIIGFKCFTPTNAVSGPLYLQLMTTTTNNSALTIVGTWTGGSRLQLNAGPNFTWVYATGNLASVNNYGITNMALSFRLNDVSVATNYWVTQFKYWFW